MGLCSLVCWYVPFRLSGWQGKLKTGFQYFSSVRNETSNKAPGYKYAKYIPLYGSKKKLKQIINSSGRANVLQKRQIYVVKELDKR